MRAKPATWIVGGGMAGYSAALWLRSYEVPFAWISRDGHIGGTLERVHNPLHNVLADSWPHGRALAEALRTHAASLELAPRRAELVSVDAEARILTFVDAATAPFDALILATGVRPRALGVAGESEARAGDLLTTSSQVAIGRLRGRLADSHIVFVGGGDGALEGALLAAEAGAGRVTIVHHSEAVRAQRRFRDEVARRGDTLSVQLGREVQHLRIDGSRVAVSLTGRPEDACIVADQVVIKIGFEPVLPDIAPRLQTTSGGYLVTNPHGRTSADRIYAAGDVASPGFQALVLAAAQGAHAAHAIATELGYRGSM